MDVLSFCGAGASASMYGCQVMVRLAVGKLLQEFRLGVQSCCVSIPLCHLQARVFACVLGG